MAHEAVNFSDVDSRISTHAANANAHHAKFTTTEHDTPDRHPATVLKTATGSGSKNSVGSITLAGGMYSFFPQHKRAYSSDEWEVIVGYGEEAPDSYATVIAMASRTSGTFYWQNRYIQSSPPYEIEHFVYFELDKSGNIVGVWEAEDPPWYGQGINGEAVVEDFPHPFLGSENKIILVNPSIALVSELKTRRKQEKRTIAEILEKDYAIDDSLEKPRGEMTERIIAKGVEFRKLRKR